MMTPYYQDKWVTIYHGDCREILPQLDKASAIVTDPPYELGFMGKSWDSKGISFQKETWQIIRKSCLSGAPLLSFGGTRTFHRIACAIEDAGWEIRDTLMWVYGSGFPKSLDISKAIDKNPKTHLAFQMRDRLNEYKVKAGFTTKQVNEYFGFAITGSGVAHHWFTHPTQPTIPTQEQYTKLKELLGINDSSLDALYVEAEREVTGMDKNWGEKGSVPLTGYKKFERKNNPQSPEAQLWEGYGTALKPAYEPIILAMNPLEGTFANNALKHGVAGLNIDECRIPTNEQITNHSRGEESAISKGKYGDSVAQETHQTIGQQIGRFPANFIHDGSQQVMELFPNSNNKGHFPSFVDKSREKIYGKYGNIKQAECYLADSGSAARFFYVPKASKAERNKGCEELEDLDPHTTYADDEWSREHMGNTPTNKREKVKNNHPTVKPLALMEYLVKLVKMPEYNLIIDPFMGSGTTLLACIRLGIPCIGIDNDEKSCEIAAKRCTQGVFDLSEVK